MVVQFFQPTSEKGLTFQLFQPEWTPCINEIKSWNMLGVHLLIRGYRLQKRELQTLSTCQ